MNKKFALAWLAIFIVWMGGSFVVHGVLLHPDYVKLPNLFRYGGARVHDLLRRAAHAGYARGQADRVRRRAPSDSRDGRGLPLPQ